MPFQRGDVPLMGLNEGVAHVVAAPGTLARAENCRYRIDGSVGKRKRYELISSGYDAHDFGAVGSWDGNRYVIYQSSTFSQLGRPDGTVGDGFTFAAGDLPYKGLHERVPVHASDADYLTPVGCAHANGYTLVVYHGDFAGADRFQLTVLDDSNRIIEQYDQAIAFTNINAVCNVGNDLFLIYYESGIIKSLTYDTSAAAWRANNVVTKSGVIDLDACPVTTNKIAIAYADATTILLRQDLWGGTSWTFSSVYSAAYAVSKVAVSAGADICLASINSTNTTVAASCHNPADSTINGTNTSILVTTGLEWISTTHAGGDEHILAWWRRGSSPASDIVETCGVTADVTGITENNTIATYSLRPYSKPFYDANLTKAYMWLSGGVSVEGGLELGDTQRFLALVDLRRDELVSGSTSGDGGLLELVALRGVAATPATSSGYSSEHFVAVGGTDQSGADRFMCIACENANLAPYGGRGTTISVLDIRDLSTERFLPAEVGESLYLSGNGGMVLQYDGFAVHEAGFAHRPVTNSTNWAVISDTDNALADGAYIHQFVFEHTNAQGERWQSQPSTALTATMTTGPKEFNWTNLKSLSVTRRFGGYFGYTQDAYVPALVAYRTDTGQTDPLYKVAFGQSTSSDEFPKASPKSSALTFRVSEDTYTLLNETIYTTSNVAANEMPPCSRHIWSHESRLCGIDSEYPNRVWLTKPAEQGRPPEYVSAMQVWVQQSSGLTAGCSRDGRMILFDADRAYSVSGGGFGNDLSGSGWGEPHVLPQADGCVTPLSLQVGADDGGIYFQSKRGICVLPRGESASVLLSQGLVDTIASYPDCLGSAQMPAESIICWTMVNSATAPTSGVIICWNYRVKAWSIDKWTSWVPGRLADWEGRLAAAEGYGRGSEVYWYSAATYDSSYETLLETTFVNLNGFVGYGVLRTISMRVVDYDSPGTPVGDQRLTIYYDGSESSTDSQDWTMGLTNARGTRMMAPTYPRCKSVALRWFDDSNGQGVDVIGFSFEYRPLNRTLPLAEAEREHTQI